MAASRSGIKSVLIVSRMAPDGARLLDDGVLVFDGHDKNPTVEGPKFYKRNGYYYIFAPAGGVSTGWQLALRSRNVWGPYESKIVLTQGATSINGPHQGAWVETQSGESWFLHFQDKGPYGRILHLEPMKWLDDWPVIGNDSRNSGTGEPVSTFKKPNVGRAWSVMTPADSDEFNGNSLGLQWQWQANPQSNWFFPAGALGYLRLFAVPMQGRNLWESPNLLLQKFPAPGFTATAKVDASLRADGDRSGLLIMGLDYAYIAVEKRADSLVLVIVTCKDADKGTAEEQRSTTPIKAGTVYLRARVAAGAMVSFSYSVDGERYIDVGTGFQARQGKWIGAKIGIFAMGAASAREFGYADFDWFRVQ
jgi:beta-xylosidase